MHAGKFSDAGEEAFISVADYLHAAGESVERSADFVIFF
jgi:hypothetical protein